MSIPAKSYCRLCAKLKPREKLTNLTSEEDKQIIYEKLNRVNATIDTFEENLPNTLCFVCIGLLEQAFQFVIQVENAQEVLRDEFVLTNVIIEEVYASDECDENGKDEEVYIKVEIEDVNTKDEVKDEKLNHSDIDTRIESTWRDFSWLCAVCDTQFSDVLSLQNHSMLFHNACNTYRCIDCRKRIYNIEKFVKHVSIHRKHLKRCCYHCSETFINIHELRRHICKSYLEFICRGCNISYETEEELKKHQDKYYSSRKVRIIPDKLKQTGLTCKVCGKTAKTQATLINHLLSHTERVRQHVCEVCGKSCLRKYDLERHMLKHTEERSYKCNICNSKFKTESYLRVHYSLHENSKPYSCNVCGKLFRLQKQVNFHQVVHSEEAPFSCDVCGKRFRFKNKLKVHERQHSGLMPYFCNICERAIRDWSNYSKHMKRMHNVDIRKKKDYKQSNVPSESKEKKKPGRPKLKNDKKIIVEVNE